MSAHASDAHPNEVRIAFDGDAVLFSDEAEQVFQASGLDAFQQHELNQAAKPLPAGPFKPLLEALHRLQQKANPSMRVRTALVTARSAPAHERAIRTLINWNIEVDEALFLGGLPKGEFLREFEPDFFFDDQMRHVENAAPHVPAGHVAAGIANSVQPWLGRRRRADPFASRGCLKAVVLVGFHRLCPSLRHRSRASRTQAVDMLLQAFRDACPHSDQGMKSIPSRRACLAAGTKSASPATRTI